MATSAVQNSAKWEDRQTLNAVRPAVRDMLLGIPSFRELSPEEQESIARTMVRVASYMANPDGVVTETTNGGVPLAQAQADAVEDTKKRLSKAPEQVGQDFVAGGVREGVEQFGALVQKVDFPKFVGGLIQNVFQAIVDSSIQQMRAYGELLANVAKTVDEYARDNISENNARDWLSQKYPDALGVDVNTMSDAFADGENTEPQQTAVLGTRGEDPERRLGEVSKDLGMDRAVTDISDPNEELRLVNAARLQMARGRQQLLASMVMMGINRIVVTDGLIHAKVIFDMRAQDSAQRKATASMMDRKKDTFAHRTEISHSGWLSPIDASHTVENTSEHVATVQSAVEDTSESKAEVKAKLSGEVRVNFKSDYFPMEKMASPQMIAAIQGNSQPPEKPVSGA